MGKQGAKNLESYRRLVEMSKQMIELSQQCEQARRECDVLRDQLAREITAASRRRYDPSGRTRKSAAHLLRRFKESVIRVKKTVPTSAWLTLRSPLSET